MKKRWIALAALFVVGPVLGWRCTASSGLAQAGATGCDYEGAYLYYANEYEPGRDCLDDTSALDVLAGEAPESSCNATCLAGQNSDGSVVVYMSTMCGPPPVGADVSGSNPLCKKALAAFTRGDYCLEGGGSTDPADAETE